MTISELRSQFIKTLDEEYPLQEVNSFFHMLTQAFIGVTRLEIALDPERGILDAEKQQFEDATKRLLQHEPVQYIIGKTEFFGLEFRVDKHVLIPRPETEELVQWIIDDWKTSEKKQLSILDIGTGSGCIAVSLAKNFPQAKVTAIDVSEEALKIAKNNAEINEVEVEFILADILDMEVLPQNFDIIVSNPPYVRELEKKAMQRNVLEHEPGLALYVKDENPLLFYEKITKLARMSLEKEGNLYFEINQYLQQETAELLKKQDFIPESRKDLFGNERMLKGILKD